MEIFISLNNLHYTFSASTAHGWNSIFDDDIPYKLHHSAKFDYDNSFNGHHVNTQCNCQPIKNCPPILDLILSTNQPYSPEFTTYLRQLCCGYQDKDPLVCCPIDYRYRRDNFRQKQFTDKPWVWDVEPIADRFPHSFPHPHPNHHHVGHRFPNYDDAAISDEQEFDNFEYVRLNHFDDFNLKPHKNIRKLHFFFHFEDPTKTFKNHPPSFSHEFELPEHFRDIVPVTPVARPTVAVPHRQPTTSSPHIAPIPTTPVAVQSDKPSLVNDQSCGLSVNTRIIGGEDADPGQFPWLARLAYRNKCKFSTLYSIVCCAYYLFIIIYKLLEIF